MIKVITFDLDNTLWDGNAVIVRAEQALLEWLKKNSRYLSDAISNQMIVAARDIALQNQPELIHQVTEWRRQGLRQLLQTSGHHHAEAIELADDALTVFLSERQTMSPYPESEVVLKKLKPRFILGSLTNGNADLSQTALDQYFDFSFSAESIGFRKPHPEIFEAVLSHNQCQADEVMHVGDHPKEDVLAAKQVGFKTVWANLTNQTWPHDETFDYQITNLLDLLNIIES